jgi:hypothetical protein
VGISARARQPDLAALVRDQRRKQGLPARVADPRALASVAGLLGVMPQRPVCQASGRYNSKSSAEAVGELITR